ncbi:MAG: hypothetical protein RL571_3364 [Pseudomonadota bacterium]|jgi:hypothetical protein
MRWGFICERTLFSGLINFIGVIKIVISNFGYSGIILNRHSIAEAATKNINTTENQSSELANFFLENVVSLEMEYLKEIKEKVIQDAYNKAYKKRFASLKLGDPMSSEFLTAVPSSKELAANNVISGTNTVQFTDENRISSERP